MSLIRESSSWTLLDPISYQTDHTQARTFNQSSNSPETIKKLPLVKCNNCLSNNQLGSQPILDLNLLSDYERAANDEDLFDLHIIPEDIEDSELDSSSLQSYLFEDISKYYHPFSQSSDESTSSSETDDEIEEVDADYLFLPSKIVKPRCLSVSSTSQFREIFQNLRNHLLFKSRSNNSKSVSKNEFSNDNKECNLYTILSTYEMTYPQEEICPKKEANLEAQLIAQSIGHAFQLAYLEFLKANGIEDTQAFKDMDYQEVLNQQEIFAEELHLFADKDTQKEVIIPKQRNESLGIVIVESGWGSMLPTVVLANMNPTGPAARCGQLNIGNQIMAINGQSLVGLPLSTCQQHIKNCRNQSSVKLTIVSCPPVVEVLIKRPDVKYQLGFSVQNGVICSLLRGGIAERGGIRVGHRIIEINGQSVVAVPHEKIVNMLATGVGEIHLRTMPTSIFRLLTGQETPHYI